MRPIILRGHERAITQICYNRESDLIFTASKDSTPSVWYTANGERLGTFNGHAGVVWCIDTDWDSKHFISGGGDYSWRLWDLETGRQLNLLKMLSPVRSCKFSYCGNLITINVDQVSGQPSELLVYDIRDSNQMTGEPLIRVKSGVDTSKITQAVWGPLDATIITGHENGALCKYDVVQRKYSKPVYSHKAQITDIQTHVDSTMIITSSKDTTAKLHNAYNLEELKTYKTERPVNSAAISPIRDHVLLGGGQEASDVTTTRASQGKFDARFFHLVFAEEFGRVKGHFGPINSVAFSPDGQGFTTGGEDGLIRLHKFDKDYFDFDIEC